MWRSPLYTDLPTVELYPAEMCDTVTPSYTHQAVINQQMQSELNITLIKMIVFLHFCFMDSAIVVRQRQDE